MKRSVSQEAIESLKVQLICHEGLICKPTRNAQGELIIGVGRKLEHVGVSEQEAERMLENDITSLIRILTHELPIFNQQSELRKLVLVNMAFSIGVEGLKKLKKLLAALCVEDYTLAADEIWHGGWISEHSDRAMELAIMMKQG
ncbi:MULTISPECIES: glycoside hydrolase family protein [Pseudoalteromonas]|uniref:Lysozyme n=1 Tax=Pseudoalteromonas luteoviolacea (strain 2ta16) TaxID=1353533 RepID=V4H6W7_PSEL2|nr:MULTISPECIES: hypothetical protein [Pseudoalteromonas]ESP93236.1 hypothetical protein PL2TA16_03457 [Pseudoalteromonas luteoviolacea 2ta16]KZN36645.1 hypothetical protein N483_22255 [Pseudoalteromonas luteoviolacea NCIMB 1944]MCG7550407.1 hypothetical protein [Pseudoalteromonas sp. Of7M-16]